MAFSGGVFTRLYNWVTEQASSPIEISKLDAQEEDIATALSNCILRDGTGVPTTATPWNSQKITGLGQATVDGDAAAYQAGSFTGTLTPGTGSAGTGTIKYMIVGKVCTLYADAALTLDSASRYGTMTLSGIPAACRPAVARSIRCSALSSPDGSGSVARTLGAIVVGTSGSAQLYLDDGLGALTASFPDDSLGVFNGIAAGWCVTYPL